MYKRPNFKKVFGDDLINIKQEILLILRIIAIFTPPLLIHLKLAKIQFSLGGGTS